MSAKPDNVTSIGKKRGDYKQGEVDPFTLEGEDGHEYSVSEFYCRSTDGKGHSVNLQVRVPPEVSAEMSKIVQSGIVEEYGTSQSMVRDAIIHRLKWLSINVNDPSMGEAVNLQIQLSRLDAHRTKMAAIKEIINGSQDILREADEAEDWLTLGQAIKDAELAGDMMPGPWRKKLEQVIQPFRLKLKGVLQNAREQRDNT